jgi:hypothetical protein
MGDTTGDDRYPPGWGQPVPPPTWGRKDETLQGAGWDFHRWAGTDPHCQRCGLLYAAFLAARGGLCKAASVAEEMEARYGRPDPKSGTVLRRKPRGLHQTWYWTGTPQHGRVWLSVQWTGHCWEVAAGRDPQGDAEGRQVQLSYGDDPEAGPAPSLVRLACVLCGVLDA